MATQRELVRPIRERYQAAAREDKGRIVDEFVSVSGYHRKHAIRLLSEAVSRPIAAPRPRRRLYDEAVRQALVALGRRPDLQQAAQALLSELVRGGAPWTPTAPSRGALSVSA